jgi:hypothetical protein
MATQKDVSKDKLPMKKEEAYKTTNKNNKNSEILKCELFRERTNTTPLR